MIRLDLFVAAKKIKFAEDDEEWDHSYDTQMSSWSKYEDAIAGHLDGESFQVVSEAAVGLAWFNEIIARLMKGSTEKRLQLDAGTVEKVRELRMRITGAYNALAPLAREKTVDLLGS